MSAPHRPGLQTDSTSEKTCGYAVTREERDRTKKKAVADIE